MDFPFPTSADDLLAVLVSEYKAADLVTVVLTGNHEAATKLAAQIDLVNTLIEWRAATDEAPGEED